MGFAQSGKLYSQAISGATATWFPTNRALTGTLSSASVSVTGTGTAFRTEVSPGDYIINASNQARKVQRVESDTELVLELAFTVDLSGATCTKVQDYKIKYIYTVFNTNAGEVRAADQDTGAVWPAATIWKSPYIAEGMTPQLITPGAGGATVTVVL